jgi:hypothetical protein
MEPAAGRVRSRLQKRVSGKISHRWQVIWYSNAHDIDTRTTKSFHASVMVQGRIHAIDTKSVDSELLEVWKVTLTCRSVGERVDIIRRL